VGGGGRRDVVSSKAPGRSTNTLNEPGTHAVSAGLTSSAQLANGMGRSPSQRVADGSPLRTGTLVNQATSAMPSILDTSGVFSGKPPPGSWTRVSRRGLSGCSIDK